MKGMNVPAQPIAELSTASMTRAIEAGFLMVAINSEHVAPALGRKPDAGNRMFLFPGNRLNMTI